MKYRVCVNNKNYHVIFSDVYLDPDRTITVEAGYQKYQAQILSWNRDTGISAIMLDGIPYDIETLQSERGNLEGVKVGTDTFTIDEIQAGKVLATRRETEIVKEGVVKAFMPGLIVRILKQAGDRVSEGETVLYMEAMKMENAITAPRAGLLSRIGAAEGSTVLTGDILFVVE